MLRENIKHNSPDECYEDRDDGDDQDEGYDRDGSHKDEKISHIIRGQGFQAGSLRI